MDELDYKPRNTRERWLLRIAYWGNHRCGRVFLVGIRESKIAMRAIEIYRHLSELTSVGP
jgi:hypothetical protein